ncbi:MAG: MFS transporter [Pseudomonadota bacterium]
MSKDLVKPPNLSRRQLLAYALPALPLAAMTLPLYTFIPTFYAESLGLPLAAIGATLFLVRAFDAVNDPVAGWLSDRWRPSFGRRRSWFALSLPVLMLGVWMLFWPPVDADITYLGIWSLVTSIGYTGCILAYTAWGAELETGYSARARLSGAREAITLLGTLVAIVVPFAVGWAEPASVHGFAVLAIGLVVALPLFSAITITTVQEPREHSTTRVSLRDGLNHVIANKPFLRLALAFFLNGFGNAIAATLFLLYCSDRLGLEEYRGPMLFAYFLAGVISVPFWTWAAGKLTKHRAWCIAMIIAAIVFSPAPFLSEGSVTAFATICVLSGLCLGADIALPPAVQADVIDVDTANSGEQRSGTYFALWSLATKLSLAIAVFAAFTLLGWFGFSADPATPSTEIGIAALGFIYGWGPILLKLPAIALMWSFPLTAENVAALRTRIENPTASAVL